MNFISGHLISLTNPIHRIPGEFGNKPQIVFCDRALLSLMVEKSGASDIRICDRRVDKANNQTHCNQMHKYV